MKERIQQLEELCAAYFEAHPEEEKTTIQLLYINEDEDGNLVEDENEEESLSYFGAEPPYIEEWPKMDDTYMHHIITLDLRGIPSLNKEFLTLFMANPEENEAYEIDNSDTFLYYHNGSQSSDKELVQKQEPFHSFCPISTHTIEVPSIIFMDLEDEDLEDDFDLTEEQEDLQGEVFGFSYIGGEPIWLQSKDYEGSFIGQFDESIAFGLNLGDCGVMYLFEDAAFWQCH